MGTAGKTLRVAAVAAIVSLAGGCAAQMKTVRNTTSPEGKPVPRADSVDLRIFSAPPVRRPEPPLSVADESRGRWLRLFEITVTPIAAGNVSAPAAAGQPASGKTGGPVTE